MYQFDLAWHELQPYFIRRWAHHKEKVILKKILDGDKVVVDYTCARYWWTRQRTKMLVGVWCDESDELRERTFRQFLKQCDQGRQADMQRMLPALEHLRLKTEQTRLMLTRTKQ